MSLIKSKKQQTHLQTSMEDIDYVLGAQRSSEIMSSLEEHQNDILHAVDIVNSLESLNIVLESMKELDVIDAALIEVVGNVAGASCNAPATYFTPSMEATDDTAPSMGARIKAIYEKIIATLRLIFSNIKAYIAHLFSSSDMVARNYEKLGNKIRGFNFTTVKPVAYRDMKGAKGGPKAVISGLLEFNNKVQLVLDAGPNILTAQMEFIYEMDTREDIQNSAHLKLIADATQATSHGSEAVGVAQDNENTSFESKPFLNNVQLITEVFTLSANTVDSKELASRAFSARTGFQYSSEEVMPLISTFAISHDLAKNIFEALRPLIDVLVSRNNPKGFTSIMEAMSKDVEKIENWMRQKEAALKEDEQAALKSQKVMLYQVGLAHIGTAQLPAFIRSHKILEKTINVVMSYLDGCLVQPKVEAAAKPAPAAA